MRSARLVFAAALTAAAGAVTPAIAATHAAGSDFFPSCAAYTSNPAPAVSSVNSLDLPSPAFDGTPTPKFEKQFLDELIPYVESAFPVGRGPSWRALVGESLGGYGSYTLGLRHPDTFASVSSVSGAMNFLFAPGIDPGAVPAPVGVSPPVQPPVRYLPAAQ